MKVRLLKNWKRFTAGHELELAGGVANLLIQRGIARRLHVRPASSQQPPRS